MRTSGVSGPRVLRGGARAGGLTTCVQLDIVPKRGRRCARIFDNLVERFRRLCTSVNNYARGKNRKGRREGELGNSTVEIKKEEYACIGQGSGVRSQGRETSPGILPRDAQRSSPSRGAETSVPALPSLALRVSMRKCADLIRLQSVSTARRFAGDVSRNVLETQELKALRQPNERAKPASRVPSYGGPTPWPSPYNETLYTHRPAP